MARARRHHDGLETLWDEKMEWKNCWIAARPGKLRGGDYGGAVFRRKDHSFLGPYIGSSTIGGEAGANYIRDSLSSSRKF